ncbi:pyridoxal phosphate-dependent decarboxylase family protein [Mycobacteroides saopaulense]|uniref:Aspartate aminotransferase family protein n=1 Tax=Mycobacteroides saopaulense TaxID=1578165 RepID=A0ABX3BXV6_9MYCO|nr:pyridoxal-dependent decarboxylase [Mycobacteroides saopaulense]OHT86738.1 aspartate aminotransferase family protein [Mycobacteroides saopaulense]OHU08595.1 aspartate aminotransferase family protein [Mycobacteroides saopaulense]
MTANQSPFLSAFLTGDSENTYREAIALAADRAGGALGGAIVPGLVDGYAALKREAGRLDLDDPDGVGLSRALDEAAGLLAEKSVVVTHPAYLAHLHCPPALPSLAAEVLISAFNQSMDSFDQAPAATAIEQQVIEYLCARMGYGLAADGTFTSGGTQSNLQALLLARDLFARRSGWDIATQGLPPEAGSWRVLCTRQTHFSVQQALRVLGLGTAAVIEVPTDDAGRLRSEALPEILDDADRAETPIFALVLTAGTTDFGAIDPLEASTELARARGIWVHVDACAGGCLIFSEQHRGLLRGIEQADSVAIDFHKLLFQAISCSALLVRHRESFEVLAAHADYLNPVSDAEQDVLNLVGKSLQTTRRFDALKVLVTLRAVGQRHVAAMIDATCSAASAAAAVADEHPDLELAAPVCTNTVVLRWRQPDAASEARDVINETVRAELAHSGRAIVGRSSAAGGQAIKLTFVNPLVTASAAAAMVSEIAAHGNRIWRARTPEVSAV